MEGWPEGDIEIDGLSVGVNVGLSVGLLVGDAVGDAVVGDFKVQLQQFSQ